MSGTFLRAALRDPSAVGGIWPSGRALARTMVAFAEIDPEHRVVELGAGTGPMTRELSAHPGPLLSLEPDPQLAAACRAAVPGVEVVEALAQDLPTLLAERGWPDVERVVSSLPFAVWDAARQDAVLDAVQRVLAPGGVLVTFTYVQSRWVPAGRAFRRRLGDRFGDVVVSPIVWRNVLPAVVYRVCKGDP